MKKLHRRLVRLARPGRLLCASCFQHRVAVYRLVVDQKDRSGVTKRYYCAPCAKAVADRFRLELPEREDDPDVPMRF